MTPQQLAIAAMVNAALELAHAAAFDGPGVLAAAKIIRDYAVRQTEPKARHMLIMIAIDLELACAP